MAQAQASTLLGGRGRGELRDRFCALRDGVLGEFTGQDKTNAGLDFPRRYGRLLGVLGELGCLRRDALEDIVDERVEDGHGLVRDTRIRVDLLEDLVDVRRVGLLARLLALLLLTVGSRRGRLLGRGLLASLGTLSLGGCLASG